MAKKKKRPVKKQRTRTAAADEEEEPEPVQYEEVEVPHPGIPRIMVTWHGSGGTERESKKWFGIDFEAGKAVAVEGTPHWNEMKHTIDTTRDSAWSYEFVVDQPPPPVEPPIEPPPPEPEPEPEPERQPAQHRRR
jgi:hypothetical protein